MATGTALLLALGAAWGLTHFVFETRFTTPWLRLLALTAAVVSLTVVVGRLGSREVFRRTPLDVLRAE
jgi:putative ABC transport system permease protein